MLEELLDEKIELLVNDELEGIRIDKFIAHYQSDLSRSYIQKLIEEGKVLVNEKNIKSNFKVKVGFIVRMTIPKKEKQNIEPNNIMIDTIYEDNDVIIINKPKGMVVHPSNGHNKNTLVNALLYHYKDELSANNGPLRPGIVHRLDKDTSGILVVCKNDLAHEFIAKQFFNKTVKRSYQAIVYNTFKEDAGFVEAPIARHTKDRIKMAVNYDNGKYALTNYKLISNLKQKYAHIECSLVTGRTHQIRVHMASINHPILGDHIYGSNKNPFSLDGQALHSNRLGFIHPTTNEYVEFEARLPVYFTSLLDKLK